MIKHEGVLYDDLLITHKRAQAGDIVTLPHLGPWTVVSVYHQTDHEYFMRLTKGKDSLTYRYRHQV
jgi:hypothetical protein